MLLISAHGADVPPAVKLARTLHTTPPRTPAAVRAHLNDVPHALPELARYAQAGDPHALLVASVLMRDQLRAIAIHAGGGDDATGHPGRIFHAPAYRSRTRYPHRATP